LVLFRKQFWAAVGACAALAVFSTEQFAVAQSAELAGTSTLIQQGKLIEAESRLQRYLVKQPNSAKANDLLGTVYLREKQFEKAEKVLMKAVVSAPALLEPRLDLGDAYSADGKFDLALKAYQGAAKLASKGDKKGALELLNEVKTLVDAARPGAAQVWGQLQLAQGYASLDPDQSFTIVQALILKTNELAEAATVLDGFDAHYLKDGEWITPGPNMLGNVINSLIMTLAALARLDFDHALAAANQIERPELRLAADLEIARAALQGKTNMSVPMFGRRISME